MEYRRATATAPITTTTAPVDHKFSSATFSEDFVFGERNFGKVQKVKKNQQKPLIAADGSDETVGWCDTFLVLLVLD